MTKVLIADDNLQNRYLLEKILSSSGYEVLTAVNGREALELAREKPPAIVISDILMPVMDGFDLCRQWKADERLAPIPFIFYTATYTDPKDERFALSLGAERFIVKPQPPEFMAQAVRETLEATGKKPFVSTPPSPEREAGVLRQYSEVLFNKLEQKVKQLEIEIENRKAMEAQLLLSEERYRTMADFTYDWEYWLSPEGAVIYMSPSCERITGYSAEEFTANPLLLETIVHPDDLQLLFAHRTMPGEEGEPRHIHAVDFRVLHRNGELRWIGHVCQTIFRPDGTCLGRRASNRDISKRKLATAILEKSEHQYRSLFENMLEGFAHCKMLYEGDRPHDFIYLKTNRAFEELTGLKNIEGKKASEAIPGIQASDPELINTYGRVALTGKPERFEMYITGLRDWYSVSVYCPEKDHFIAVFDVITKRKRAEEELTFKNVILNTQLETTIDAVLAFDDNHRIMFSNRRFLEMWDIPPELIESRSDKVVRVLMLEKISHSEEFMKKMDHLDKHREEKSSDEVLLEDGRVLERYSAPMMGTNGRYFGRIWYFRDITERKKAERQLLLQAEMLDSAIDSIFLFDTDGNVAYANRNAASLRGYEKDEILTMNVRELNDPENATAVPGRLRLTVEQGFALYETIHVKKNGTPFNVEILERVLELNGKKFILSSSRDVTRRNRAAAALAESEERYRTLFELTPDVIFTLSANGTILALNPAFEKITKWPRDQWIGRPIVELVHPDDITINREMLDQTLRGGTQASAEIRIKSNSGSYLVVEFSSAPYTHGNTIEGMHGIARDVTARKQAEEAIRESEEKFRTIFDNLSEGVYLIDLGSRKFTACNTACAVMLGYSREEFLNQAFYSIHPEDDVPYIAKQLDAFAREETGPNPKGEIRFKRKDGSIVFVEVSPTLAMIDRRKTAIVIFTDITTRKRAEAEIKTYREHLEDMVTRRTDELSKTNGRLGREIEVRKETETNLDRERTLLRTLIDALPEQIYAKDREGRFIMANAALVRSLGLEKDNDIVGKTNSNFSTIENAERIQKEERAVILEGRSFIDYEEQLIRSGDERRWRLITKLPLLGSTSDIIGLVGIIRDITKLKNDEENLQLAKDKAESANRAKSAFLTNMSHEIRTPMNAILGFSQLMLRDADITPRQRERLTIINRSGEHLITLINDILEISKIEAGHVKINITTFDFHALIGEIEAMFRAKTDVKRLALGVVLAKSVPRHVTSDEGKIRQILINLVGNALKFTDEGVITIRLDARKKTADETTLSIEVEDTGKGIPQEDRDKIFDIFEQGSSGASAGGTGLGLALSRHFAQLLNGALTMTSRSGRGSCFHLEIPVRAGRKSKTPARPPGPTPRVLGLRPGQKRYKILVADDNPDNRKLLGEVLASAGFEVLEAENGREAVERFNVEAPDLIFMDLNMSVMNGYEATELIKRAPRGASTPVVAVTSSAFAEVKAIILKSGIDRIIIKPFREKEVFDALKDALGVIYVYEEKKPAGRAVRAAALKKAIADLPDALVRRMAEAAQNLEMNALLAAIDEVEKSSPPAAGRLRELAQKYQYDSLMKLIRESRGTHE